MVGSVFAYLFLQMKMPKNSKEILDHLTEISPAEDALCLGGFGRTREIDYTIYAALLVFGIGIFVSDNTLVMLCALVTLVAYVFVYSCGVGRQHYIFVVSKENIYLVETNITHRVYKNIQLLTPISDISWSAFTVHSKLTAGKIPQINFSFHGKLYRIVLIGGQWRFNNQEYKSALAALKKRLPDTKGTKATEAEGADQKFSENPSS